MPNYVEEIRAYVEAGKRLVGNQMKDPLLDVPLEIFDVYDTARANTVRARGLSLFTEAEYHGFKWDPGTLEAGSGLGFTERALGTINIPGRPIFSDKDAERLKAHLPPGRRVMQVDMTDMSHLEGLGISTVYTSNVLDQFPDPAGPVTQIARILPLGGILVADTDLCPSEPALFERHKHRFLIGTLNNLPDLPVYYAFNDSQLNNFIRNNLPPDLKDFVTALRQYNPAVRAGILRGFINEDIRLRRIADSSAKVPTVSLFDDYEDTITKSMTVNGMGVRHIGSTHMFGMEGVFDPLPGQQPGMEYECKFGSPSAVPDPALGNWVKERVILSHIAGIKTR